MSSTDLDFQKLDAESANAEEMFSEPVSSETPVEKVEEPAVKKSKKKKEPKAETSELPAPPALPSTPTPKEPKKRKPMTEEHREKLRKQLNSVRDKALQKRREKSAARLAEAQRKARVAEALAWKESQANAALIAEFEAWKKESENAKSQSVGNTNPDAAETETVVASGKAEKKKATPKEETKPTEKKKAKAKKVERNKKRKEESESDEESSSEEEYEEPVKPKRRKTVAAAAAPQVVPWARNQMPHLQRGPTASFGGFAAY